MTKRYEKMMRLWMLLKKSRHCFWGISDGLGQEIILDPSREMVPGSDDWLIDYLAGLVTARHIHVALIEHITPYEVAERTKKKAASRKRKTVEAQP